MEKVMINHLNITIRYYFCLNEIQFIFCSSSVQKYYGYIFDLQIEFEEHTMYITGY